MFYNNIQAALFVQRECYCKKKPCPTGEQQIEHYHRWGTFEQSTDPQVVQCACPGQLPRSDTSPSMITCTCLPRMFTYTLHTVYLVCNHGFKNSKFPSLSVFLSLFLSSLDQFGLLNFLSFDSPNLNSSDFTLCIVSVFYVKIRVK